MRHFIYAISSVSFFTSIYAFSSIVGFPAQAAEKISSDPIGLVPVGDDCIYSTEVFNQRLTKQQMLSGYHEGDKIFSFITDICDSNRISMGIFGEQHILTRKQTHKELGRGEAYSNGKISVTVIRGHLRSRMIAPPPAACDDDYLEQTEYFDATTIIKTPKKSFKISSTLRRFGCRK